MNKKRIYLTEAQLKYIISESLTDVVFHFTTVKNLYNIVKNDKLYLSNSFENVTDSYMSSLYPFYLSLTRSFNSKFGYVGYKNASSITPEKSSPNISNAYNVRIEFDGRALNSSFKGEPVNYHWKENTRNAQQQAMKAMYGDKWNLVKDFQLVTIRQDEDRLLSKKPLIDDVSKYITRIDITLDVDGFSSTLDPSYVNMLYGIISNKNYTNKIFIYDNESNYNRYHNSAFINDKIVNAFKNLHGFYNNTDSINTRDSFIRNFGRGHNADEPGIGSAICEAKIIQIAAILKYIYSIDRAVNINGYFSTIADELLKYPCPFNKEEIISKFNTYFNSNFTKDEISKKIEKLKDNFHGNLRGIYTLIVELMSNVFRRYILEHRKEVFDYLNSNSYIKVKSPTFTNMVLYFLNNK